MDLCGFLIELFNYRFARKTFILWAGALTVLENGSLLATDGWYLPAITAFPKQILMGYFFDH